ncbi:hypothetical protein ACFPIK_17775 [Algoriphagus aquatilis]|uniref:Outer membrane protein beta-barrel domain-containing protein n=1 Tax=Algoriphagus aquatilis TaxID=490186 RepID=A0ABW0C0W9_9BACT
MLRTVFSFIVVWLSCSGSLWAQSFYKEKNPKTVFYQVGIGAGTFFSAPRPSYDSIVNEKLPVLSLAVGKRIGSHLSIKSNFSFQPFSSKEYMPGENGNGTLEPIFNGYNYAFDVMPIFNLLPSFHHMSRPIVDFNLGVGLGYLLTYRTEKFFFNEKYYQFNLFESSAYIPVRASLSFRLGIVTDLIFEGAFFNTFLDDNRSVTEFEKESDHFGQVNVVYRRFIR